MRTISMDMITNRKGKIEKAVYAKIVA